MSENNGHHDQIAEWEQRWSAALDLCERQAECLAPLPSGGEPQKVLDAGVRILQRLRLTPNHADPLRDASKRFAERLAGTFAKENAADLCFQATADLERRLSAALNAGAEHPDLIDPRHFGVWKPISSGWFLPERGDQPVLLFAGYVNSLPAGHRLRTLLPDDDFYRFNGVEHEKVLLCGPLNHGNQSRLVYARTDAEMLTRNMRAAQVRKEQERAVDEERSRRDEAYQLHAGAAGQLRQQLKAALELDRLVSEGKLPELPNTPTVLSPAGK